MRNFLLIEHGGQKKKFVFDVLKRKRLNTYLVCTDFPLWLKDCIRKENVIITDTFNSVKLLSSVVAFMEAESISFDAIGTFFEHVVVQTADLANALGLIGLDPSAARRSSSNKLLMRRACRDAGLPTPKLHVLRDPKHEDLLGALKKIGIPSVIKPIFGAESFGTVKIESRRDIDRVLKNIKETTKMEGKEVFKNFENIYILEEYLSGKVVSVDGIVQNRNINIAGMVEFVMGPEPWFVQEANYIPPRFGGRTVKNCMQMATSVIETLGFDNCGFHCELRITENGPVLIEIAARLPGGPLQPGYKKAYNIDLTSSLIDVWCGKKVVFRPSIVKYILQKAIFPRNTGKIHAINGVDRVKKIKGVWDFVQIANEGDLVITYPSMPKPFYYFALCVNHKEDLPILCNEVERVMNVEVM